MRVTYDSEANALYAYVRKGKFHRTETINDFGDPGGLVNVDRDADGNVLGVEFVPNTVIAMENITARSNARAEGWRAGYAAGLETAEAIALASGYDDAHAEHRGESEHGELIAKRIRHLAIPEET